MCRCPNHPDAKLIKLYDPNFNQYVYVCPKCLTHFDINGQPLIQSDEVDQDEIQDNSNSN